ncbi:MFS transporter [Streptomyces avidinii]
MPPAVPEPGPVLSARRRWTVLAVCALSMFLVGVDTTIVNVGLPAIGRGLGVGTHGLEWAVDAYTVVLAGLLIASGALADRFGRRRVFRCGLVLFGLASLGCALAPSLGLLVAARAVQGVGASMLSPVALAIVMNAMPDRRERARAIGVWASVFGLSMAAGPVVGGVLIAAFGWRSVFWINAPVIVAALVLVAVFVPESRGRARRLDLPGQVLLTAALCVCVGVLIEGPRIGWTSAPALACYAAGVLLAAAFVRVELRRTEPLMDLGLFRRPPFAAAALGAVALFAALNAALLLNTLYLQNARGWTPLAAGTATLPMALGATLCAPWSGAMVARSGPRRPLVLAGGFTAAGGLCLTGLGPDTSVLLLLLSYLLIGTGFGFANAPITNTAVGGLPAARVGVAGAITSTARQAGSAVGIAVAGGLVAGAGPAGLAGATRPGWLFVTACGLSLFVVARASGARAPEGTASEDKASEAKAPAA